MDLWIQNLIAHAVQSLLLVAGGLVAERALRNAHPAARLAILQAVLAGVVLLPFVQAWRPVPPVAAVSAGATAITATIGAAESSARVFPLALLVLLASGVLARCAWIAGGMLRLRALRAQATAVVELPDAVLRAMADLRVAAEIRVAEATGPFSFGIRHPVILLPPAFARRNERSQYLIVCHELLHVRRRDAAQALAEEIVVALVWYHPWIWWLRSRIQLVREQVVDRAVAQDTSVRDSYVRSLLEMTGHRVPAGLAGAAVPRVRELRDRIDALYREVSMSRTRLAVAAIVVAIGVLSLAALSATAFPLRTVAASPVIGPQEDDVVRIGGDVKPPRKIKDVKPVYPEDAKEAGIEGVVIIEAVINKEGLVAEAKVLRSVPELDQSAVDAVLQWEFEPTYVKGKAVSVRMTITVNFTLA